ncbi:MAG TPA: VWA domain-containing protein [Candidatus Limnocylindria bacterium]|nr:VWA domain-containing protein [Candidatus Limnocylindria bacterium]
MSGAPGMFGSRPDEGVRYSRWDGTQRLDALEAEELLGAMSDELLAGGDLEDAMARLARWGMPGRMEGMQDLLERLRAARQRRGQRHDLSRIFDDLKRKLDEVKGLERATLERRRDADAPDAEMKAAMERFANERLAQLDQLPEDVGPAIRALQEYEFVEPKAAEAFQELLKQLQQQVLGSYFRNMRDALKDVTPEQIERMRQMLRDLDRSLRERMEGGEPDFEAFQRQYPELAGGAKDWDDLVKQLAMGMAAMRSLWNSMPGEMREQLDGLLGAAFQDPRLQEAMSSLAETLSQLIPMEGREHDLTGDQPLSLSEALALMQDMDRISEFEEIVASAREAADLEKIDPEEVGKLAGNAARQALEELQRMTKLLEDAGLIRKDGDRYELTPRGIRKIGQRSLEEIFATLKKDAFGSHRARLSGRGGDPTDETKRYEFGDQFLLDLPGTLRNAVMREAAEGRTRDAKVRLRADDFDVWRTELVTQSATAILVDVSRSMLFRGCFLAAKKVTLALDALIRSTYPKDDLFIVGFSAAAEVLKPTDLPGLTWNEYVYGTNMQHAFATARRLLSRSRGKNKQIVLITDGEPTAHFEAGAAIPSFSYPPTRRTYDETLREVVRCTREQITINTFMLARGHYLIDFVNQMSKVNAGRAFYVEPERLGEYVLVDYVKGKRRRVA